MTNPYLKRLGRHGQYAERKAASRLKGQLTPASGAKVGAKGDIRKGAFLIESKATNKESLSLKRAWLDKISKEALDTGKDPALIIQFVDGLGHTSRGSSWVCIPERVFHELCGD